MRPAAGTGNIAAFCFAIIMGAILLLAFNLSYRTDSHDYTQVSGDSGAAAGRSKEDEAAKVYLVRPEAPDTGVNVVKELHQRPPATDAEAAEWLDRGEMVTVEPGASARIIPGKAPGFAVNVEVLSGPSRGLRGWVWQDTLRDTWP